MSNSTKILYEKKYPTPIEIFEYAKNHPAPEEYINESKKNFVVEEMYRKIKEESVYIPRPERKESALLFQKLVIYYSELYEITVKVSQNEYDIHAVFTIYSGIFNSDMIKRFSDLLKMSDDVSFIAFTSDDGDGITITLHHYTHDYYISGHLIN